MKKSYRIAFLLVFLTSPLMLLAQQVASELAKQKALTFLTKSDKSSANRSAFIKTPRLVLANDRDEFYVFNDEANGGYVVVSGDERMPDVLGYSYTGHFDAEDIPCNMRAWLEEYANQVVYLKAHPEAPASRRSSTEREEISPLLKCHYDQGKYYNDKCPIIDGEHCYTGCVATAMSQIMYYYQWPKQTTEIIPCYTTGTRSIDMPAIPVTTIDWDNMLEQYDSEENYSEKQIDAISTLMLLCGTSVKMDYNIEDGSGAYLSDAAMALRKYFDYDDLVEYVQQIELAIVWEERLYDELKDGRPVLYEGTSNKGDGHAFVLDGYREGFFHVNWGWGGNQDDYFILTNIHGFNKVQGAVFGIRPPNTDNPDSQSQYGVLDNGKITLYYDREKAHRMGTILHQEHLYKYAKQITECVIDPSYVNLETKSLSGLFYGMSKLKSIQGLEYLNTSKVQSSSCMFYNCSSLTNLDVSGFKTDNVSDMSWMFYGCSNLTNLDVSGFKTDNVTDMNWMFYGCSSLTNLDVSGFKTDNVANMLCMFDGCSNLKSLDVSGFKTDKVTGLDRMFYGCSNLIDLDVSGFNTEKVTSMSSMFSGCSNLTNLDVSGFKTDNVIHMEELFSGCSGLTNLDVSGFKTDKVYYMRSMFSGCSNLTSLDVSGFKTDKVNDMNSMFRECSSLKSLDLSSFNILSVWDTEHMFSDCSNLTTIYANEHWNMSKVNNTDNMFVACNSLIGGAGTTYDSQHINGDYAHIDGGPDNPGYFTNKASRYYTVTYIMNGKVSFIQTYEYGEHINPPAYEGVIFTWSDIPETMPDHDIVVYGSYTLGINDLQEEKQPVKVFSLQGRSQNKMQKGINIIRYSDGSVRKVLVK